MAQEREIQELQMLEHNMQQFLMQKQQFQAQLIESENALIEIEKSKDKVYKILGATIIEANKENIKKELEEKIKLMNLRIKSLEKQESAIKEKLEKTQKEVLKKIKS